MSFKCGWQAGGLFVAYIFVLGVIVRIIFGDHSLAQAGTECATLGLYCGSVYALGYYLSGAVSYFADAFWHDLWHLAYIAGGAILMWNLGEHIHATVQASFTSTFFLVVYTALAGLMAYLGFDDERSEAYMNCLAANNML